MMHHTSMLTNFLCCMRSEGGCSGFIGNSYPCVRCRYVTGDGEVVREPMGIPCRYCNWRLKELYCSGDTSCYIHGHTELSFAGTTLQHGKKNST